MNIVFVINNLTHFHILSDYIRKMHSLGHHITTILVKAELAVKESDISQYSSVKRLFKENDLPKKRKEQNFGSSKKGKSFLFYFLYFFYLFFKHYKIIQLSKKIINDLKPELVIVSSDRYTDFDLFFAKVSLKKNIKVFALGIDYFYVDTFETYYKSDPNRKITTQSQKILAKLMPSQVFKVKDFFCIYYPPHLALNLFLMNALPKQPFLTGSRFVTQIHVDCEVTKNKYIQLGVSENKIKVTGLLEHDLIANSITNKDILKKKYNCGDLKIVILAVPQGWEHNLITKEEHFAIIENVISTIRKQKNICLILSLHPKMNINNYIFLKDKYKLEISDIPLRDFLCIADLFIATYSSTVLWSAILNKPCIVFDLYQLNYECYSELKNVTLTRGYVEFSAAYEKHFIDSNAKGVSNMNGAQFGLLDKKSFQRFLDSINEK